MNQTLLIGRDDIAKYKQISATVPPAVLNPQILSAQMSDVRPLIGSRLYRAITENPAAHAELLDGGIYTIDGEEYENYGLKAVVALYANARYVYFGSNLDTPFGQVNKLNGQNSTPTSESNKKAQYIENKREAYEVYWSSVQAYLALTEYELYDCQTSDDDGQTSGGFSITTIGR